MDKIKINLMNLIIKIKEKKMNLIRIHLKKIMILIVNLVMLIINNLNNNNLNH
jgi:hypothetical protein